MALYTKFGDGGQTALFDGRKIGKDNLRIVAYGTVDELNSQLGVVLALHPPAELGQPLERVQHQLFDLGADLATPVDAAHAARVRRIDAEHVRFLEQRIDEAESKVPPLKRFVMPGGCMVAAQLHLARTVCRRAEREVVALQRVETINPQAQIYLNRLSDWMFALARWANVLAGVADVEWVPQERK